MTVIILLSFKKRFELLCIFQTLPVLFYLVHDTEQGGEQKCPLRSPFPPLGADGGAVLAMLKRSGHKPLLIDLELTLWYKPEH